MNKYSYSGKKKLKNCLGDLENDGDAQDVETPGFAPRAEIPSEVVGRSEEPADLRDQNRQTTKNVNLPGPMFPKCVVFTHLHKMTTRLRPSTASTDFTQIPHLGHTYSTHAAHDSSGKLREDVPRDIAPG